MRREEKRREEKRSEEKRRDKMRCDEKRREGKKKACATPDKDWNRWENKRAKGNKIAKNRSLKIEFDGKA